MSYWKVRQQEQLKALEKDEKELMNRLLNYYQAEYAKLDKEIASFYKRYGEKNIIEYRNLLLELPQQEKKLLIEQVEKFAKQYPHLKHIVPVRENIYKLNRLEGLQLSIVMQQFEIGAYNEENVRKHLEKLALRNVNSVADLLGFGKNFYFENKEIIKNFVGVKWCEGKDFSMRIWQNTEKLANYLTTDIAQGFARGESYEKLTTLLGKRFINVTKKDVYRVIYTEGTYVMAESSAKTLEQEFEQYKLSTVSDGKECSKCREIAGKTFNFDEREPGVNFPPIHPMCRCTFEIIVDDWNKWLDEYEKKHSKSGKKVASRLNYIEKTAKSGIIKENTKIISDEKFVNYALNPTKSPDKSKAFEIALGYTHNNYKDLKTQILELCDESKFIEKGDSGYGMRYEYIITITGANGKKANVLTAWIQDGKYKRLTSIYVTKRKATE